MLPKQSLFLDEGTHASAAVLLQSGGALDGNAISGIARLVSSSVEDLKADDVTITDETGTLLWPSASGGAGTSTSRLQAEQQYSNAVSAQIDAMLASTLGIDFNVDESWDEKKEIFKISGKIVRTRNVTQSTIVKNSGYTTVLAAAVFIF